MLSLSKHWQNLIGKSFDKLRMPEINLLTLIFALFLDNAALC
jgi:hypothetical protein